MVLGALMWTTFGDQEYNYANPTSANQQNTLTFIKRITLDNTAFDTL
jgi:hypothetical protein